VEFYVGDNTNSSSTNSTTQHVTGFSSQSQYWRLFVVDNYGGPAVGIRKVSFIGYTNNIVVLPFTLNNTGSYHTYYIPIGQSLIAPIQRLRFEFYQSSSSNKYQGSFGTFQIEFIRIVRAPEVHKVTGCIDIYYDSVSLQNGDPSVTSVVNLINGVLPLEYFAKQSNTLSYATTFDCPLDGGIDITVEGVNFGESARVFVGDNECIVKSLISSTTDTIICTLPSTSLSSSINSTVTVQNGVLPGLFVNFFGLFYRTNPVVPSPPLVTNIGARRVDLLWQPPGSLYNAMATTGYKIAWYQPKYRSRVGNMTVGNVTTTSIRGLNPESDYVFAVAAVSEGVIPINYANQPTDLYGRRAHSTNSLLGGFSNFTSNITTLKSDFEFTFFNANLTLNYSVSDVPISSVASQSLGPTGLYGGEGSYGLAFIGSANVENCNATRLGLGLGSGAYYIVTLLTLTLTLT
jgi:hypothetical protein